MTSIERSSSTSSKLLRLAQIPTRPQSTLGLHQGAASGNLGLVKFALDRGVPINSVVGGILPIHAACCHSSDSHLAVVQYLIERGADVNALRRDKRHSLDRTWSLNGSSAGTFGSTPLHFASANHCTKTVELLLSHGARADICDRYGNTPLSIAVAKRYEDIVQLLRKHLQLEGRWSYDFKGGEMERPRVGDSDFLESENAEETPAERKNSKWLRRSMPTAVELATNNVKRRLRQSLPPPPKPTFQDNKQTKHCTRHSMDGAWMVRERANPRAHRKRSSLATEIKPDKPEDSGDRMGKFESRDTMERMAAIVLPETPPDTDGIGVLQEKFSSRQSLPASFTPPPTPPHRDTLEREIERDTEAEGYDDNGRPSTSSDARIKEYASKASERRRSAVPVVRFRFRHQGNRRDEVRKGSSEYGAGGECGVNGGGGGGGERKVNLFERVVSFLKK
ncbi:uncharacterized protein VTP21DRAFT_6557 [Calcarisporiella thermophila]|uniref:uncharacterized protein n=1 Tax=Calcarisporiella thermophila TaxID=911321 RepID=UPI0037427EF6